MDVTADQVGDQSKINKVWSEIQKQAKLVTDEEKEKATPFHKRNIDIQKYNAAQYSHRYHLKNLRTLEPTDQDLEHSETLLVKNAPWILDDNKKEEDYYKKTKIDSHIYNGIIYSIVRVLIRSKAKNSKIKLEGDKNKWSPFQSSTLILLKHNPDSQQPDKIFERELSSVENEHDWSHSLKPYLMHKEFMFFPSFVNDFKNDKIKISIETFDFKKGEIINVVTRTEDMKKANEDYYEDKYMYAVNCMLSHEMKVDSDSSDDDEPGKDGDKESLADWQKEDIHSEDEEGYIDI